MRNVFKFAAFVPAVVALSSAFAVERIDEPLTFRHALQWRSGEVVSMSRLDRTKLTEQDIAREREGKPRRVAVARTEKPGQEFERQGEWSTVDDMSVWRLKITADDAMWLGATLEQLSLPPGASLYIYNESRDQVHGPYTHRHIKNSGKLWLPKVDGETANIEINVPTALRSRLSFDLTSINYGYRSLKRSANQKSGACNIDVVCPEGDAWRDQIRSVAHYIYQRNGDFFVCTGSLVNNTSGDRTPYFLTANHCVSTADEVESMVLYWNFETSVCGGAPDGELTQVQTGATLLATLGSLDGPLPERDMTLIELDATPDPQFNVFFSGWDSSSTLPDSGVTIHHPDGDEKRISLESGPITRTGYLTPTQDSEGTHLRIEAWDQGTTEQGSSGAGFWNASGRIVGVLSGGAAACDNPAGSDYFAFLAAHYDVSTTAGTRLSDWLDPQNTGATGIDGLDSCDPPTVTVTVNPNPAEVNQPVAFSATVADVPTSQVSYAWDFDDDGSVDSTEASPSFTYTTTYVGDVGLTATVQTCSTTEPVAMVVFPEGGNIDPVAIATAASDRADEGTSVQLNGSGSQDPNGDALSYVWTQTAGPTAVLSDPTAVSPTAILPMITTETDVVFELTVTDIFGASGSDSTTITVQNVNRAPLAIPSQPAIVANEGALVTLNAAASSDADGDNLTYAWTQTSGAAVTLTNAQTATSTFTAPQVSSTTVLAFTVTVTDTGGLSDTATVNVTVNNVAPPPGSGGGGGGALGWPSWVVLSIALALRRSRRVFSCAAIALLAVMSAGCGTADNNAPDASALPSAQAEAAAGTILLVSLDPAKASVDITNPAHVRQTTHALENRERRYEKLKPLFEYEIRLLIDGQTEVWQVNRSGYVQKKGTNELYRMDTDALIGYMK